MKKDIRSILKLLGARLVQAYQTLLPLVRKLLEALKLLYRRMVQYFKTHPTARRWSLVLNVVLGPLVILLLVVWIEIPGRDELRNIQNHEASEVYSADSVLLGRFYIQDRTLVAYEDIAPVVEDALIATEDVRFYEHAGIDYLSLGRVLIKSIFLQEESAGGGSTLSQQLSKNLYPRKRYWMLSMVINKLREAITAQRLENIYSKEELITLYLNTVPFGDGAFGIQAAAKRFYNTTAKALTPDQAAVLIGMLKATHSYNPRLFPERALERRNVVLGQMEKYGFISQALSDSVQALPLDLNYSRISFHQGLAPYFREFVKAELLAWCKKHKKEDGESYNIYTDGLKVYTTLDSRLQRYAEQAVTQQMKEVQKQFFDHWGKEKPWKGNDRVVHDAIARSPRYQGLAEQGMSHDEILDSLRKPVTLRLFTWDGEKEVVMSPIDSIIHHIAYLNAGFLAIEPQTGKVKAWVGGIDHDFFQYDHVRTSTKRQVGSIFKPIVYAMAIERGTSPCEFVSAERQTYIDEEGEEWTPRNMQNDYQVRYSMRGALAYSVNTVAVKMIQRAGVSNTVQLARSMGILAEMPNVPSIALGSSSVSLMEMTTAFACLANEGVATESHYIHEIRDRQGKVLAGFGTHAQPKRALSKETALLVRQMLQTVVHEGTASRLRWRYGIYNDVAGKTGTTQANADGWFMAMTPCLVVGTWVGADDPRIHFRTTDLGQGSNTALPMFAYFMKQVNADTAFKALSKASFTPLPKALRQKLTCDLYELDESLLHEISRTLKQQDSLQQADTLAAPRRESFLEKLYKRKMRVLEASLPRDTAAVNTLEEL